MGTDEVRVRDSLRRRGAWDRGDRGVLALSAGLRCALIPLFILAIVSRTSDKHPGYTAGNANGDLLCFFAATLATPPRNETRSCDCGNDHEPGRDLNNEDVNHSVPPRFRRARIVKLRGPGV